MYTRCLHFLITTLLACNFCNSQSAIGCSTYGCNPSGTFSFVIIMPETKAAIAWTTDFFIGPVPFAAGCVSNKDNVLCPSNGPRDVSYISLYIETGGLVWRDFLLRFPQLPVTDSHGNVYGSDGHFLVSFDVDGHFKKQIRLDDAMFPIFSAKMTANNIIFLASKNGHIQTFYTDGAPHASLSLHGYIKKVNGTFMPVATPAVAGNRVYVLTKFNASLTSKKEKEEIYRLYVIDVVDDLDPLQIVYYLDFEKSIVTYNSMYEVKHKYQNIGLKHNEKDKYMYDEFIETTKDELEPRVMCTNLIDRFYVSIPGANMTGTLYALDDNGKASNVSLLFQLSISLRRMSLFMINSDERNFNVVGENPKHNRHDSMKKNDKSGILWGLENNKEVIIGIDSLGGHTVKTTNISIILGVRVVITSEIMVVRKDEDDTIDTLVFGIKRKTSNSTPKFLKLCHELNVASNATSYLVYLTENGVSWIVPSPRDLEIVGQIAGVPNRLYSIRNRNDWQLKDLIVSFAGNETVSAVFGVW